MTRPSRALIFLLLASFALLGLAGCGINDARDAGMFVQGHAQVHALAQG